MNKKADRAQMESDDVAAVNVLSTGERDNSARNIRMDDLNVFTPAQKKVGRSASSLNIGKKHERSTRLRSLSSSEESSSSHTMYPATKHAREAQTKIRGSSQRSFSRTKIARKMNIVDRCWVTAHEATTKGQ